MIETGKLSAGLIFRILAISFLISSASSTLCPPIKSQSQGIQCFSNDAEALNCDEALPIGAQVRCKPFYASLTPLPSCGPDGWTEDEFSCQIVCGKSKEVKRQERPFAATIYQKIKRDLNSKICAATLIGDGYVLTIAHCLLDHNNKQLDNGVLLVGLGPMEKETMYSVKSVHFTTNYNGTNNIDAGDLVILTLVNFTLSGDVIPACLPTCGQMDEVALRDGSTGEMFGRGQSNPQKLKVKVTANCSHFNDFCAGNPFNGTGLKRCPEEIGTGITITMGEETHFIYGILSSISNPSCNNFRTFKRLFPFIHWIRSTALLEHPPLEYTTTTPVSLPVPTEEVNDPISSTTPTTMTYGSNDTSLFPKGVSGQDQNFEEVPKEDQEEITTLVITNKTIMVERLLNSLKFAKKLKRLEIEGATITSGFDAIEELPEILEYVLKCVEFTNRPTNFAAYFPFYKDKTWNSSDLPIAFDEINIDDGFRRFVLKPNSGRLVISNFPELKVDKIISGLPSEQRPNAEWKRMTLHKTQFNSSSIPSTLAQLSLANLNITGPEMSNLLLTKLRGLEELGIHELQDRELKLEDLPQESLRTLRLDRVNLTFETTPETAPSSSSIFSGSWSFGYSKTPEPEFPVFENLSSFYWGVDVFLDDSILTNFDKIFPNVRLVAYYERDNLKILSKMLELKKLELLYLRIQSVQSNEGQSIMAKLNFEWSTVANATSVDMIQLCVERHPGDSDFVARYVSNSSDVLKMTGKFPDEYDIPKCAGFDG